MCQTSGKLYLMVKNFSYSAPTAVHLADHIERGVIVWSRLASGGNKNG